MPKRTSLNPVEDWLKEKIIAQYEQQLADKLSKDLSALRRDNWQFLPFSPPLPIQERKKWELLVSTLISRVEKRKQQREIEEQSAAYSQWDVEENVSDIHPDIFKVMQENSYGTIVYVKGNDSADQGQGNNKNTIIKWNPIVIIKRYRREGDPLRHIDFKLDFYSKVLAKYYVIYKNYLAQFEKEFIKGFDAVNIYRKSFSDRNWKYTLFEWFWICRYAQAFTPRRASKMLQALDDREGKVSPKYIKNKTIKYKKKLKIERRFKIQKLVGKEGQTLQKEGEQENTQYIEMTIFEYWVSYHPNIRPFMGYIEIMNRIINFDPELREEYAEIVEQDKRENEQQIRKIQGEYFEELIQQVSDNIDNNANNDNDGKTNDVGQSRNEDFRATKIAPERIIIHHSNPNYRNEIEEYSKGLRKEKPKRKISCRFSLYELPREIKSKLVKDGIISITKTK